MIPDCLFLVDARARLVALACAAVLSLMRVSRPAQGPSLKNRSRLSPLHAASLAAPLHGAGDLVLGDREHPVAGPNLRMPPEVVGYLLGEEPRELDGARGRAWPIRRGRATSRPRSTPSGSSNWARDKAILGIVANRIRGLRAAFSLPRCSLRAHFAENLLSQLRLAFRVSGPRKEPLIRV